MKKNNALNLFLALLVSVHAAKAFGAAGSISKINLLPSADSAVLILNYEGKGGFKVLQNEEKATVVLEVENLSIPGNLTRAINVASSGSPVIEAIPYSASTKDKAAAKIVLQLKENVLITKSESNGRFILEMKRKASDGLPKPAPLAQVPAPARKEKSFNQRVWVESDELKQRSSAMDKSEELAKKLVEVLNSPPNEKNYFGSKVTVESSDMSIHDVFRLVGEASGLNIVTDSDVKATLNFSLKDIPWDQLLDIAMQQADLRASVTGSVVRVYNLAKYNLEQESKRKEIISSGDLEPTILAIIPVNFAKANDAKNMIESLLASDSEQYQRRRDYINSLPDNQRQGMESIDQALVRGKIRVDDRTNSLIITNTKSTIERIKKLIAELDIPIPQVLIDAKVVIASDSFTKTVGVNWGARITSGSGRAGLGGTFNNGSVQVTGTDASSPAFSVAGGKNSGIFGFQLGAGPHANLNAALNLAEVNGTSKTIASPRVIVNNRTAASISDGQSFQIITPGTNNGPATSQLISAKLQLDVTPQVTNSGSVLLTVNLVKDQPDGSGSDRVVNTKSIKTEVLVDSGSTLVLGGVYQLGKTSDSSGIPLLKDLPFLGNLFRTDNESIKKDELMVFITPQILYPGPSGAPEAGGGATL